MGNNMDEDVEIFSFLLLQYASADDKDLVQILKKNGWIKHE